MDTAHRINVLIERSGLSNQAVADAVRVSDETIDRWRKGKTKKGPSLGEAILLAKRLGTTVEYLATGREPVPAELSPDEVYLIQVYRDLGIARAEAVRRLMCVSQPADTYPVDVQGGPDRPISPGRRSG